MAKRLALWALFGVVGGYALSTWLGMRYTHWFFDPGEHSPISCAPVVEEAFSKLLTIELWGSGVSLILFVILGSMWERSRSLKAKVQAAQAAPPTAR